MTHDLCFHLLYEAGDGEGAGLTGALRTTYGGDWLIPQHLDRCYVYSNFVVSHDGRISFDVPGHEGGGDVSDFNRHDQWLMGLLRSRADAVMVGAQTLRSEPEHEWTAEFIFPEDAQAFASIRRMEDRRPTPWQVFVTASGDLPVDARVMTAPGLDVLVITTQAGADRLKGRRLTVVVAGAERVDFDKALGILFQDFGIATLECEGGPRVYAELVAGGLIDDEFITQSPVLIGAGRPALIEGVTFQPGNSLRARLRSVRRAGDHLFIRSSYETVASIAR